MYPEIAEAWEDPRHYTVIAAEAYAVNGEILDHHRADIDPGCLWMEDGRGVSARDYYNGLRASDDLTRRLTARMAGVDAFLAPTTVATAWSVEKVARGDGPDGGYTHNSSVGNVLNLPGVSVPSGANEAGLPIGLTIHSRPFGDAVALRIANTLQSAAPDLLRVPKLAWAIT